MNVWVVVSLCLFGSALPVARSAALTSETDKAARVAVECSAYFFMAANVKAIDEFDDYYSAGEYAYNRAVTLLGESDALAGFNTASSEISELIQRNWSAFDTADDRYGVVCAELFRDAHNPDR